MAICPGDRMLGPAKMLQGKKATGFPLNGNGMTDAAMLYRME